jgi:hypothetical protein
MDHNCLFEVARGTDGLDENGLPQGHLDAGEMLTDPSPTPTFILTTSPRNNRSVCHIFYG